MNVIREQMRTGKNYGGLDRFRIAAAVLVIAIHTSPLTSVSEGADFFLTRVLARIAVPFFFMVTGQFVAAHFLVPSADNKIILKKYMKKTLLLYAFCILLYLPIGIYAGHYQEITLGSVLRMLIFDGTFYHLWYFPACILGVLLVYLMSRFLSIKAMAITAGILYVIGLFGDSYFGLAQKVSAIDAIYGFIFQISSYTRNGIFLAPLFLVLGAWIGERTESSTAKADEPGISGQMLFPLGLTISFSLMTVEAFILRHFELQRHDSMYLMLIPVMFFLYQCLLRLNMPPAKGLRTAAAWVYILHPAFIVVVRVLAKLLHQTELLVDNSVVHYLAVTLLSVAAGFVVTYVWKILSPHMPMPLFPKFTLNRQEGKENSPRAGFGKSREAEEDSLFYGAEEADGLEEDNSPEDDTSLGDGCGWDGEADGDNPGNDYSQDRMADSPEYSGGKTKAADYPKGGNADRIARGDLRAWIEIDEAALRQNVTFLRSRLPKGCRLMPSVKAEGYGHGAVLISQLLNRMGVDNLCVACLSEGIDLREAGIQGEILILGYTPPEDFPLLNLYRLAQTVIDYDYAKCLNRFGKELHVHIGIDTGMHRIGIRCENVEEIMAVYDMENLSVDGIFTHLSASDSPHPQDRAFTDGQIQAFYQVVDILESEGYSCRGLHLLASYGILNLLPDQSRLGSAELVAAGNNDLNHGIHNVTELAADYVRPGIALYGVLSTEADSVVWRDFLKPVLSLKARVASVRALYAGEAAGYGIAFTAMQDMRIATISIGYADGLPRELSNGKGSILINGYDAPIIGRICMDQTIVDVSRIPDIQAGDTAVIIGKSGKREITVGRLAEQCDTITNEILSRLGARLDRVLIESGK